MFQKNEEDQYYEWLKGQRNEDLPGVEELVILLDISAVAHFKNIFNFHIVAF